jgi:hypothetical protein
MGGASKIRAPKPQANGGYNQVYQKDGNYYKQDAPKQSAKGNAINGPKPGHDGNPMKVNKGKGQPNTPSYSQIDGAHTMDMPRSISGKANRFVPEQYQGQQSLMGRQPAGRRQGNQQMPKAGLDGYRANEMQGQIGKYF